MKKILLIICLVVCFYSCSDENSTGPEKDKGEYTLAAKYSYLRSYPDGGGVFIVYITPEEEFSGEVKLKLNCDENLNAQLEKSTLGLNSQIAEITINPNEQVEIKKYTIELIATHSGVEKKINLEVELFNWSTSSFEDANAKLLEFKNWLLAKNPEYSKCFSNPRMFYSTYPEILIVEHFTFLTDEYEVRLCNHVMIKPDDWSKICIRKRNSVSSEVAAYRNTDGNISGIPLSDYPTFFGY